MSNYLKQIRWVIIGVFVLVGESSLKSDENFNIIPNPSFEERFSGKEIPGWKFSENSTQQVSIAEHMAPHGSKCLKIENKDKVKGGSVETVIKLGHILDVPYRQDAPAYLVQASAYIDNPRKDIKKGDKFCLQFVLDETFGVTTKDKLSSAMFDPGRPGWQHISFLWRPKYPVDICHLLLTWEHPGIAYFDNIKLIPADKLVMAAKNKKLPQIFSQSWKKCDLNLNLSEKNIPKEMVSHIGTWQASENGLIPVKDIPPSGAILRSRYTYLLQEFSLDFERTSNDGALYLVLGDWRISLYPDHVRISNFWQPLSRFPVICDLDTPSGKLYKIRVSFTPHSIAFYCNGKMVADLDNNFNKIFKKEQPVYMNLMGWFAIQAYKVPVVLKRIEISGLQTGIANGFERLKWPSNPVVKTKTANVRTYTLNTKEEVSWEEKYNDPVNFRYEGDSFLVLLKDIDPGDYKLRLSFWEDQVKEDKQRFFDISVQGRLLFPDVDVVAESGANFAELIKECRVKVGLDKEIGIAFRTRSAWPAIVNRISLLKDSKPVYTKICGFKPGRIPREYLTPATMNKHPWLKFLEFTPHNYRGCNAISDPGFELAKIDSKGFPTSWKTPLVHWGPKGTPEYSQASNCYIGYENGELWPQGKGKISIDENIRHGGKKSLCISSTTGTFGLRKRIKIDYTRPYEFKGWIKTEKATGKTCIRIDWQRMVHNYRLLHMGYKVLELPAKGTQDWQQFTLPIKHPYGAQVMSISVYSTDNKGKVWFDDFEMDAFGILPVEAKVSHGGYDANGNKEAVIWTREKLQTGTFSIVSEKDKTQVFQGELKNLGWDIDLCRNVWLADFSDFKTEGNYMLCASFPTEKPAYSYAFEIKKGIYYDFAKLSMEYFKAVRANAEVPGWHGADALDDGLLANRRDPTGGQSKQRRAFTTPTRYVPIQGNYYDAADCSRKPMGMLACYGFSEMSELWQKQKSSFKSNLSDPLFLAWWVAKMYVNSQREDGTYYGGVSTNGCRHYPIYDPAVGSDGIPGTGDEKFIVETASPEMAFVVANFALKVQKENPELSKRCADSALKNFTAIREFWEKYNGSKAEPWKRLVMDTNIGWAAMYLSTLFPQRRDLEEEVSLRIKDVVELMKEKTFLDKQYLVWTMASHNSLVLRFNMAFAMFAMEYAKNNPDKEITGEIKQEIKIFLDKYLIPCTKCTAFGKIGELSEKNPHHFLSGRYHNGQILAGAQIFARAARLLNDRKYLAYAERQVQWIVGKNYYDISLIAGAGKKLSAVKQVMAGVAGHEDSIIPGGGTKGFVYNTNKELPFGLPLLIAGVHSECRDGYTSAGQEYWKIFAAYFVICNQEIQKTMEYFSEKPEK